MKLFLQGYTQGSQPHRRASCERNVRAHHATSLDGPISSVLGALRSSRCPNIEDRDQIRLQRLACPEAVIRSARIRRLWDGNSSSECALNRCGCRGVTPDGSFGESASHSCSISGPFPATVKSRIPLEWSWRSCQKKIGTPMTKVPMRRATASPVIGSSGGTHSTSPPPRLRSPKIVRNTPSRPRAVQPPARASLRHRSLRRINPIPMGSIRTARLA